MSMNSGYSIPGPGLSGNLSKDILILVDSKWTLMLAAHSEKVYIWISMFSCFLQPPLFLWFLSHIVNLFNVPRLQEYRCEDNNQFLLL